MSGAIAESEGEKLRVPPLGEPRSSATITSASSGQLTGL